MGRGSLWEHCIVGALYAPPVGPGCQEYWCILGSLGEFSCSPAMQNCGHYSL